MHGAADVYIAVAAKQDRDVRRSDAWAPRARCWPRTSAADAKVVLEAVPQLARRP